MSLRNRVLGTAIAGLIVLPTLTAHADMSLAETQYWAKEEAAMKEVSDATNTTCGAHITFDWVNKADLRRRRAALAGARPLRRRLQRHLGHLHRVGRRQEARRAEDQERRVRLERPPHARAERREAHPDEQHARVQLRAVGAAAARHAALAPGGLARFEARC